MQKIADHLPRMSSTHFGYGCPSCKFGIVVAPDILRVVPFYEGRAVQAHEDLILFCSCKAGHLYRQVLRKRYNDLSMTLRRLILEHISAANVPTVHGETT